MNNRGMDKLLTVPKLLDALMNGHIVLYVDNLIDK